MKPQVSIVMPFRDAEATIMDSIQSVLEQSHQNWELRLIDDHSRDKSGDLIKKVVAADSRVFMHLNPGVGICDALNHGIEESTSSLIARMDADDLMRKNRIFEQSVFMRNNPRFLISMKCQGGKQGVTESMFLGQTLLSPRRT